MDLIGRITPETVSSALRDRAGLVLPADEIKLEQRFWRWVAYLPNHVLALVPDCAAAANRLEREAKLLQLLGARVSFGLPSVLHASFGLQVRSMIPGAQVGGEGRECIFASRPQGARLADDLGRALGELHSAVTLDEAEQLGFEYVQPLPRREELRARLDGKLTDPLVARMFSGLLEIYDDNDPSGADIVFAHGDVWGGNLAVNLETGELSGLFDFDDAGLADRHIDFMYIHSFSREFAHRTLAAYERQTGMPVSWQRSAIYHTVAAFAALAEAREQEDTSLLNRRLEWISAICRGPIGASLLGLPAQLSGPRE